MTRDALRDFLRLHRDGVVATVFGDQPEAAVVGIAVNDACEVVFDALESTHKVRNLRLNSNIALTVWSGSRTAQVEGMADGPRGGAGGGGGRRAARRRAGGAQVRLLRRLPRWSDALELARPHLCPHPPPL